MAAAVRTVPVRATRLLAVCGKCGRKLGGGFGKDGDTSLAKMLRRGLASARGKRAAVRIVETKCLDICPKHAVAVIDGDHPGEVLIVASGTSVETVAARFALATA